MKLRTPYYEPHRSPHSFTTATFLIEHIRVQEWDVVAPQEAERVLETSISHRDYAVIIKAHGGNEEEARRAVVHEARHHVEQSIRNRLTHRAFQAIHPGA